MSVDQLRLQNFRTGKPQKKVKSTGRVKPIITRTPELPPSFKAQAPVAPVEKLLTPEQLESFLRRTEGVKIRLSGKTLDELLMFDVPKRDSSGAILRDADGKPITERKRITLSDSTKTVLDKLDELSAKGILEKSELEVIAAALSTKVDELGRVSDKEAERFRDKLQLIPMSPNPSDLFIELDEKVPDEKEAKAEGAEIVDGRFINVPYILRSNTVKDLISLYITKYSIVVPGLSANKPIFSLPRIGAAFGTTPITFIGFTRGRGLRNKFLDLKTNYTFRSISAARSFARSTIAQNIENKRTELANKTLINIGQVTEEKKEAEPDPTIIRIRPDAARRLREGRDRLGLEGLD